MCIWESSSSLSFPFSSSLSLPFSSSLSLLSYHRSWLSLRQVLSLSCHPVCVNVVGFVVKWVYKKRVQKKKGDE